MVLEKQTPLNDKHEAQEQSGWLVVSLFGEKSPNKSKARYSHSNLRDRHL